MGYILFVILKENCRTLVLPCQENLCIIINIFYIISIKYIYYLYIKLFIINLYSYLQIGGNFMYPEYPYYGFKDENKRTVLAWITRFILLNCSFNLFIL